MFKRLCNFVFRNLVERWIVYRLFSTRAFLNAVPFNWCSSNVKIIVHWFNLKFRIYKVTARVSFNFENTNSERCIVHTKCLRWTKHGLASHISFSPLIKFKNKNIAKPRTRSALPSLYYFIRRMKRLRGLKKICFAQFYDAIHVLLQKLNW